MTMYYINLGRWADSVIGPFGTDSEAEAYIDTIDWRGERPTVMTVRTPLREYTVVEDLANGVTVTATVKALDDVDAAQTVHAALGTRDGGPNSERAYKVTTKGRMGNEIVRIKALGK